jgi:MoxR-like ATPase
MKQQSAALTPQQLEQLHARMQEFPAQFKKEIRKVIVGQEEILDLLLVGLFCNGHILLTGVPGLAKTLLIKTLANLFHLEFNRIQCTPDLMPSDISGVEVLDENPHERTFRFIEGPVFTNLLLADEINRTSPRTQAALLQAMQEKQVTVSGKTHQLSLPFIVFATQNPIDSEGTYPLPEAQLDRFLFNVDVGYPTADEEVQIALQKSQEAEMPAALFTGAELLGLQQLVDEVPLAPHLVEWAVQLVRATRPQESALEPVKKYVEWGAGVRASQSLVRAARAKALLSGENVVTKQHLRAVMPAVLRHRIIVNFVGEAEQWSAERIIALLLEHHT